MENKTVSLAAPSGTWVAPGTIPAQEELTLKDGKHREMQHRGRVRRAAKGGGMLSEDVDNSMQIFLPKIKKIIYRPQ